MSFADNAIMKNRLVNAGVLIVLLIVAAKVYQGRISEMARLKEQQEEEHKKNNLLDNIEVLEKKLDAFSGMLRDRDEGVIMNVVNSAAQEAGLKLESVRPGAPQRYQQYIKTPYFIESRARSYHVMGQFIAKMESNQVVFIIERVNIRKDALGKELLAQITLSSVSLTQ